MGKVKKFFTEGIPNKFNEIGNDIKNSAETFATNFVDANKQIGRNFVTGAETVFDGVKGVVENKNYEALYDKLINVSENSSSAIHSTLPKTLTGIEEDLRENFYDVLNCKEAVESNLSELISLRTDMYNNLLSAVTAYYYMNKIKEQEESVKKWADYEEKYLKDLSDNGLLSSLIGLETLFNTEPIEEDERTTEDIVFDVLHNTDSKEYRSYAVNIQEASKKMLENYYKKTDEIKFSSYVR